MIHYLIPKRFLAAASLSLITSFYRCSTPVDSPVDSAVANYDYRVVAEYPHRQDAFTQGLVYHDGVLYESTGLYGRSSLRKVSLPTGEVLRTRWLPNQYFGEGMTVLNGKIIQLTWESGIAFIYDLQTFDVLDSFYYQGQGWGLTHNDENLIMSDGSPTLRFLDTLTYQVSRQIRVTANGDSINRLNELEFIQGEIYANIWQTHKIARISPATGKVTGWIHLDGLLDQSDCPEPIDVLNGIAYDAINDRLLVTGKWWCKLFQIELIPR